jgi:hypothetical protein
MLTQEEQRGAKNVHHHSGSHHRSLCLCRISRGQRSVRALPSRHLTTVTLKPCGLLPTEQESLWRGRQICLQTAWLSDAVRAAFLRLIDRGILTHGRTDRQAIAQQNPATILSFAMKGCGAVFVSVMHSATVGSGSLLADEIFWCFGR